MADDDLFIDSDKLKQMIALGIYEEDVADKVKNIKNKDLKGIDNTMVRPPDIRPAAHPLRPESRDHNKFNDRGRGRGGRGQRGFGNQRGRGRGWSARMVDKIGVLNTSAFKWQEMDEMDAEREEQIFSHKRQRSSSPPKDPFRDGFREGIRDGIQTKIQRNEIERKLNDDFINERNAGNSCDTDLRPKSDTDSRIRDTDLRPTTDPINNRKTTSYSTAKDDYKPLDSSNGRGGRSDPKTGFDRQFFSSKSETAGPSNVNKNLVTDDIDDFIEKANKKLNISPSDVPSILASRGRGGRGIPPSQKQFHDNFNRNYGNQGFRSDDPLGLKQNDDPLGLKQSDDNYDRRPSPENRFDSVPDFIKIPDKPEDENPSKHIEILRETVEELAKSNLYCQYCDCYLGSLVEVNTHIGTSTHQQNMTKKEEEINGANSQSKQKESSIQSQTIVERVPTGMAAMVQMIKQNKQITLKSLTEMDNYEINSDSEAALAKELAKLLTNELLNYKMNLMPDTVKEALKHQGIGLLNSMVTI